MKRWSLYIFRSLVLSLLTFIIVWLDKIHEDVHQMQLQRGMILPADDICVLYAPGEAYWFNANDSGGWDHLHWRIERLRHKQWYAERITP